MADPGSNLSPKESLGKRVYNAIHNKLHYAATSVGSITRPIYKAAVDVKDSALHLIRNPPENPGVFSTAPPYEKNMEEEAPIERTDEYEKVHRFAPYSLSKKDKDIIREAIIKNKLGCTFLRIKDYE
jgi:hypothetical protein